MPAVWNMLVLITLSAPIRGMTSSLSGMINRPMSQALNAIAMKDRKKNETPYLNLLERLGVFFNQIIKAGIKAIKATTLYS